MRLGRKRVRMTKRLASPLCPIKRTHWNGGKRAREMCQEEFLKKDEDQGCDLYEALAEKTI